jgi:UDP-4-amino-4,6-dideoxy-N-acetyl-beta-L-altrosamine transaminase
MRKMLPYGHQWVDESDIQAVVEALKSDYLTTGSRVNEFEERLAEYCGAKYAVVVSSGTSALHCACYAVGIKNGDEVITTPITFFATLASIMFCGGRPVLSDIDETLNINPCLLKNRITTKTKAIIPVDMAGHPADLDKINIIAKIHGLKVIEDACHALGAEYKGKKVGGLSDLTVFSFHPVKAITTFEGGAVLTNNRVYYEKMLSFRNHNINRKDNWHYEINEAGYNYRLSDVACAMGISQLKKLDYFIDRRRFIADQYNEAFKDMGEIIRPIERDNVKSAYHLYIIQLKTLDRDKFIEELSKRNIGAQIHYIPCHLQPAMRKYYKQGDFPVAEKYYSRCLSLPIFPKMTDEDIQDVINNVKEVINEQTI